MMKIIRYLKDFNSQSEFEIVLRRILESQKANVVKELKYQVILESFNGSNENAKLKQQVFEKFYKYFKQCRNDIAALKILLVIHRLISSSENFRDNVELEYVLEYYRQPQKQTNSQQQYLIQNIIYQYLDYLKNISNRSEYYYQCWQGNHYLTQIDINNQIASLIVILNLLKKLKQFINLIEILLIKKKFVLLIKNLVLQILQDASLFYNTISTFVYQNQYKILEQSKDNSVNLMLYQLYVETIQITHWIKKLFQLANLAAIESVINPLVYFIVNPDQNREYEFYIQSIKAKYDMRSPDPSPKFQEFQCQKKQQFQIILLKPQQLNTAIGQSERPLEYIEQTIDG